MIFYEFNLDNVIITNAFMCLLSQVIYDDNGVLVERVRKTLESYLQQPVAPLCIDEVSASTVPPRSVVILMLKIREPFTSRMSGVQMKRLQVITDNARILLWITSGRSMKAEIPHYFTTLGLSRALMLEQPSLRFAVYDFHNENREWHAFTKNMTWILDGLLHHQNSTDLEYIQHESVLYCSRFVPDRVMNETFSRKQLNQPVCLPL